MQAHAFLLGTPRRTPFQPRHQHQTFFKALENLDSGHLTLITPEGYRLEFTGREAGPDAHLKLYSWSVLDDFIASGEMGFADAYIHGKCGSENLPALLTFALMNSARLEKFFYGRPWYMLMTSIRQMFRRSSIAGSTRNALAHYDLGNEFYALWLDKGMAYSCALFEGDMNRTLEEAQAAKYERILNKLNVKAGDSILEIGCGWGGFAEATARRGCRVLGLTLSREQQEFASQRLKKAGLGTLAKIELTDYRKIRGKFDHVVSIGMFEHVGENHWSAYFHAIRKCLKPGGSAMVQTITIDEGLFETLHDYSGFMEQVIFPGGMLPSKRRFCTQAERSGLECGEIFAFGEDYIRTLEHWLARFHAQREEVKKLGYDEAFLRLWRFYLSACIASFISGRTSVMQVQLTRAD